MYAKCITAPKKRVLNSDLSHTLWWNISLLLNIAKGRICSRAVLGFEIEIEQNKNKPQNGRTPEY